MKFTEAMKLMEATQKQKVFATFIAETLGDDIEKVYHFDKYDISEYISSAMNDPDKKKKINERKRKWRTTGKQYQRRLQKPWISDESLGGEWGLDASDFGAQAWGGS